MFAGVWGDPERYAQYFNTIPGAIRRATSRRSTPRATSRCWAGRTTSSTSPATASRPPTSRARSSPIRLAVRRASSASRTRSRARRSRPSSFCASATPRGRGAEAYRVVEHVRYHLGPIGTPAELEFVPKLPKTRSGKIMRRLSRRKKPGSTSATPRPSKSKGAIAGVSAPISRIAAPSWTLGLRLEVSSLRGAINEPVCAGSPPHEHFLLRASRSSSLGRPLSPFLPRP
jgi:hypothetical protein